MSVLDGAPRRTLQSVTHWRTGVGRPPLVVAAGGALVAAAALLPTVYLILRATGAGAGLWGLLFRMRTAQILGRTITLMAAVTASSLAISLPLAWLIERTDLPHRRLWSVLTALPLVIPSYVMGFIVVAALGPRGMLQQTLAGPLGIERLPSPYGFPGAWLTVLLASYPYMLLLLQAAIRGLDGRTEEVARSLGYGRWGTFVRVTLAQLLPAIAAGSLLVALYVLRDFGAVSLLRYETFTWAIYLQYQTSIDRSMAAALALVPVLLAAGVLYLELRSRQTRARYDAGARGERTKSLISLGKWRWPALFYCGLIVLVALIMPLGVLGYWLGRALAGGVTLQVPWPSVWNSVSVSALAAVVTVVAAVPIAILDVRYPSRLTRLLERATYSGFGLPGIVIALALVFFGANYARALYQTTTLLVLAYAVLFLPQAVGAARSSLLQANPRMEEAARSLGRSPMGTLVAITLPMMRPGLLAGAGLVFLTAMKELPATLLLGPTGFRTLATAVWSSTAEGMFASAALSSLLLILLSSVPMAFLALGKRTKPS
jgi:iron(III) transport system permease protein